MEKVEPNNLTYNQRDNTASSNQKMMEHGIHKKPATPKVRIPHKGGKKPYKALRKKEQKIQVPLPELGQPGGRDDPLRRGLSGAGCRWYLRYLSQGLAPEEARRKAEEHKAKGEKQETSPSVQKQETSPPSVQKRKIDETIPAQTPLKKKKEEEEREIPASTPPSDSYAMAAKKIEKIAILPKAFPAITLSANEQTMLEEAIVEEMFEGWEHKIQFKGIHFRPGMIVVECESPQSAEWLHLKVPRLKNWKGVELTTRAGETASKPLITASIFFPRCQGQTPEKLLTLVEAQNEGLKTGLWNVLTVKDGEKGQLLRVGIDENSYQNIKSNGYTIHYRFGKIPVHGLKKQERATEEPLPSTSKEKIPESDVESVGNPTPQTSVAENSHP